MKSNKRRSGRPAGRSKTKWRPLVRNDKEYITSVIGGHKATSELEDEKLPSIFDVEKANKKLLEEASKHLFLEKAPVEYSTRGLMRRLSTTKRRVDAEELVDLVWRCGGDLRQVANVCGVKRGQVKTWLTLDCNLEILEEIDEAWNDVAENVVNQQLLDGNFAAAQFRLQTKAKNRGYVLKTEVEMSQVIQVVLEGDAPAELNAKHETLNVNHEEIKEAE